MKKVYIIPVVEIDVTTLNKVFLDGASGEGMGYGGDAGDHDITDADSKNRDQFNSESTTDRDLTFDKDLW